MDLGPAALVGGAEGSGRAGEEVTEHGGAEGRHDGCCGWWWCLL